MASLADMVQLEYGNPIDELELKDVEPDLDDCCAGLSSGSILRWPIVIQDETA